MEKDLWIYGTSAFVGFLVHCCRRSKGDEPCPDPWWRCAIGFVLGFATAVAYKYVFIKGADFTTMDLFGAVLSAYALSAFVYKITCPKNFKK